MTTNHPQIDSNAPNQTATSARTSTFGIILLVISLAILFIGVMLCYIAIRFQFINPDIQPNPPLGQITLPPALWVSTFVLLLSGAFLHYSLISIRLNRTRPFAISIRIATILGIIFVLLQIPCLYLLIDTHKSMLTQNIHLYGMICLLIIIHGLHLIGGIIPLSIITVKARHGAYTSANYYPVLNITIYWHFIDIVWLIMFNTMIVIG